MDAAAPSSNKTERKTA